MSRLQWSDALSLDMPAMDAGLKTFVTLLDLAHEAPDTSLVSRWRDLVLHTAHVFEREDRWMRTSLFPSAHIHITQHKVVLDVMQEGLKAGESGDLALIRKMADELGQWFANHSQSMDAALALHLRKTGYDPATGVLSMPDDIALAA
ncbi:hemerythrin domain-containing protein [Limnohabitans parvus]|nr:hemerythrin [Limnohabitans parvus]MBP6277838.1 hemerythrin [Limnohabitans sp.]